MRTYSWCYARLRELHADLDCVEGLADKLNTIESKSDTTSRSPYNMTLTASMPPAMPPAVI